MRILFVNYEYPPLGGGGGVMNAQLAQEMAKSHEITVLTSQGLGLPGESVEAGVRVLRAPVYFRRQEAAANFPSMFAFLPSAYRVGRALLQRERFDVINTHFVVPTGPVGDALARYAGIPNVLTVHGGDLYDPSKKSSPHRHPALRWVIRSLLRRADMVVGQSKNTLENVSKFYDSEIKNALIPLGIYRPVAGKASRQAYGFAEDDFLLVTVGRLIRRKAVEQLIQVIAELRNPSVRLLIVGSGPDEAFLKNEAQKRGVVSQVHFLGFVEEVEKYRILEMSDLYVSTAQHEGFCLAFLEGMSAGLPIVCYDNGGHMDYLQDGATGFTISLNDLELFRKRTATLIANPELRRLQGAENRRRVEAYYVDTCAASYEALFNQAIAEKLGAVQVQIDPDPSSENRLPENDLLTMERSTISPRE